MLLALVVRQSDGLRFGRLHRSGASTECVVRLSFGAYDWQRSDVVDLALSHGASNAHLRVEDHLLKTDPQRATSITAEAAAYTGAVWPLAMIDRVDLVAELAIVAKSDTVATHGRWRLSHESEGDLPERYRFLLHGAVSG